VFRFVALLAVNHFYGQFYCIFVMPTGIIT